MSKWERIDHFTARMAVPGGWIVKHHNHSVTYGYCSMVFYPDEYHSWNLKEDYSKPTTRHDTGPK